MDVHLGTSLEVSARAMKNEAPKKEKATPANALQNAVKTDRYEHVEPEKKGVYDKHGVKVDRQTIEQLKEESDRATAQLKQIVSEMLKRQGLTFQEIKGLKIEEMKEIEVDETARKEAQAMIAEGGEYSPEKVSDRIVEFAKAISGGDVSKLDMLKTAVDQGFGAAGEEFGDELPDICKETYQLIMDKLDAWAKEDQTLAEKQPGNQGACANSCNPA